MTRFGDELIQSLSEALAYAEGREVLGLKVHTIDVGSVDAKAIRKKLDLTQEQMATALGTSPSGYKKWEQGQRQPSGCTHASTSYGKRARGRSASFVRSITRLIRWRVS